MPGADRSEIYFIAAMMILIMILSIAAIYFFVKTYKKEMREKEARKKIKAEAAGTESEIWNFKFQISNLRLLGARSQKTEIRSQQREVRRQKKEGRIQKSEIRT